MMRLAHALLFILFAMIIASDLSLIYLGATALGVFSLLSTTLLLMSAQFWMLRFTDTQLHPKRPVTVVFVGLFLFSIFSLLTPHLNHVPMHDALLPNVSDVLAGSFRSSVWALSLLLFSAFMAIRAALERSA